MSILMLLTEPLASGLTLPGVGPARKAAISGNRTNRAAEPAGWRATIARWFARSRQRWALREIAEANDIHLLKDIGVSREEAFREAEKPFWRR